MSTSTSTGAETSAANSSGLRVAVTGYQGKVGVHVVDTLLAAGHEVVGIDQAAPNRDDIVALKADLTDYGQAHDALGSVGWDILGDSRDGAFDVVVHLAAITHPRMVSNSETFRTNITIAYNLFEACRRLGLRDVVLGSSETVHGVPFGQDDSDDLPYLPLDEDSPQRGRNAYGLSKMLTEQIAAEYAKNDPGLRVTALRLSYVQNVEEYAEYPGFADDPETRVWDLWSNIDARDVATAVEAALHYGPRGFEPFLIAANDTVMPIPTAELLQKRMPGIEYRGDLHDTAPLMSNRRAAKKLGWKPAHTWRDHV